MYEMYVHGAEEEEKRRGKGQVEEEEEQDCAEREGECKQDSEERRPLNPVTNPRVWCIAQARAKYHNERSKRLAKEKEERMKKMRLRSSSIKVTPPSEKYSEKYRTLKARHADLKLAKARRFQGKEAKSSHPSFRSYDPNRIDMYLQEELDALYLTLD